MATNKTAASLKRMNTSAEKLLKKSDKIRPEHKDAVLYEAALLKRVSESILSKCGGASKLASLAGSQKAKTKRKK
jgi:hypothetical protein